MMHEYSVSGTDGEERLGESLFLFFGLVGEIQEPKVAEVDALGDTSSLLYLLIGPYRARRSFWQKW